MTKAGIKWTSEWAIPFATIGVNPKSGDVWKINIAGHQVKDGDIWICWNASYGLFSNTAQFGNLHFE